MDELTTLDRTKRVRAKFANTDELVLAYANTNATALQTPVHQGVLILFNRKTGSYVPALPTIGTSVDSFLRAETVVDALDDPTFSVCGSRQTVDPAYTQPEFLPFAEAEKTRYLRFFAPEKLAAIIEITLLVPDFAAYLVTRDGAVLKYQSRGLEDERRLLAALGGIRHSISAGDEIMAKYIRQVAAAGELSVIKTGPQVWTVLGRVSPLH